MGLRDGRFAVTRPSFTVVPTRTSPTHCPDRPSPRFVIPANHPLTVIPTEPPPIVIPTEAERAEGTRLEPDDKNPETGDGIPPLRTPFDFAQDRPCGALRSE